MDDWISDEERRRMDMKMPPEEKIFAMVAIIGLAAWGIFGAGKAIGQFIYGRELAEQRKIEVLAHNTSKAYAEISEPFTTVDAGELEQLLRNSGADLKITNPQWKGLDYSEVSSALPNYLSKKEIERAYKALQ